MTDADRIAQLETELAKVQRDFETACNQHDAERAAVVSARDRAEAARAAAQKLYMERDAALANVQQQLSWARRDIGTALDQRDEAQAEAAAMRAVLEEMTSDEKVTMSHRIYARMKLDGVASAGRALAARKVPR